MSTIVQEAEQLAEEQLKRVRWALGLSGLLSILFGIVLFARPGEGALALVWVIGVFAIARGALLVLLSFRLRGLSAAPSSAVARP